MLKTLLFNNMLLIIQYAVNGLIPLVLIPHIVRNIGLASFGDIAIALSWANYASIVVQYAFQLTGPRYLVQSRDMNTDGTVFWSIFAVKLLLFLLLGVTTVLWTASSSGSSMPVSLLGIYALLPLGALFHSGWYLQAVGRFIVVTSVSIVAAAVSLFIGLLLVKDSGHSEFAAISLVIGSLMSGVGTFLVSVRATGRTSFADASRNAWSYMRDGWSIFLSQFIAAIYMLAGPIIIGWLLDSSSAGAYSAVERIVTAVSSVCLLTHTAAYPKLAGLYTTDRPAYVSLMKSVLYIYFALALLFCVGLALAGPYVSQYLFGKEAASYDVLLWWGVALILLAVFGPAVTGYYVVSGQQERIYPLTIKVLLVSIILGIPGVRFLGVWAWFCALAIAQSMVLWTGVRIVTKRR